MAKPIYQDKKVRTVVGFLAKEDDKYVIDVDGKIFKVEDVLDNFENSDIKIEIVQILPEDEDLEDTQNDVE